MGDPLRRRPLCVGRALLAGWAKCTGVAGVCQTACSLAQTAGTAGPTRRHSSVRDGDAEDITRSMRGRGNSDRAERATAAKMTTPPAASTASGVRFAGTYFLSVATFPTTPPRAAPPRVPAALPVTRAPPTAPIPAPTAVLRCFSVIPEQPAKVPATRRTAAAFANVFMIVSMGGYPHESSGAVVEFRRLPSVTCGWVRLARFLQPAPAPSGCFFAKRPGHAC